MSPELSHAPGTSKQAIINRFLALSERNLDDNTVVRIAIRIPDLPQILCHSLLTGQAAVNPDCLAVNQGCGINRPYIHVLHLFDCHIVKLLSAP